MSLSPSSETGLIDALSDRDSGNMSEVAEEAMDSSAVSEEEEEVEDQQEATQEDTSSPDKSSSKISAVGEILEGKRAKKTVERLDFQAPKQKEKLKIGDGSGDKLGDIPRTGFQITKMKPADLKPLHTILFDRPGKMAMIKKNLRLFNGFPFDTDSEQYAKKREKLLKNSNFTNSKLKVVCGVLDLEKKGTHSDLVDRIMSYLTAPKNSGKRLPVKKKRKSKKKLSGDDSNSSTKKKSKPKPRSSSSSPKKSKTGSKSKAIVMDSSSDEDDEEEEEEEKAGASAEAEGSDTEDKPSEKEEDQSNKSEESEDEEEDDEDEDDDESPKSKSSKGKSAPKKPAAGKRPRAPAKKTGPPKKRAKKESSDESESEADSEEEEKPKKKKPAPAKPAAKTKKADSSSNSKNNTNTAEDSSDDDEPLIKMIKKAPTDEQLKATVQSLLKEANLEEMTMKQICQRVFDTYPDHDLTGKKDYIKQTVKSLIT